MEEGEVNGWMRTVRSLTRFQKPSTLMSILHIAVRTRIILLGVQGAVSKGAQATLLFNS